MYLHEAGWRGGARVVVCLGLSCFAVLLGAADGKGYRHKPLKEPPPKLVSKKVRELLPPGGIRIVDPKGKPLVDLWLRKNLATRKGKSRLGVNFGQIPVGTLLGVARFPEKSRDFRGNSFPAGTYTFRYMIQPEDGDHLGVSETRDYLLLCRVKEDKKPDPMKPDDLVKLSMKVSRKKHPSVLYLMKMFEKAKKLPRLVEEKDLEYWIFDCEVPHKKKGKKPLRLGVVLVGEAEE